jgi:4-amino-4-deoxy-L-arabinose transferase-like glycosyltransferase
LSRKAAAAAAGLFLYFLLLASVNSYVAGGSDSSGYLNAARLFRHGRVFEPIAILRSVDLPVSDQEVFIPLGFRSRPEPRTMAPTYPPGMPLQMAAAAAIGGWEKAPFALVPLSAIAALILLYLTGRNLGLGPGLASIGALLLAGCPIFLGMAVQPMSDVPATAWVLASIFFGVQSRRRPGAAFLAGAALGVAVLVRPTNALAAIPLAFALGPRWKPFLRAAAGFAPIAAALLAYNAAAFGGPFETGYERVFLSRLYVPLNLRHYGYWVPALLTPLVALAWSVFPFDRRAPIADRLLLLLWFAVFPAFYVFYEAFDDWWAVRFLLPGLPAMILAALLLARDLLARCGRVRVRRALTAAGALFLAVTAVLDVRYAAKFGLLSMSEGETLYRHAGQLAQRAIPGRSIVLCMQMSGALTYYTHLPIARWDRVTPETFPRIRDAVRERGFAWYALLRDFEHKELARAPGNWTRIGNVRDVILWRLD